MQSETKILKRNFRLLYTLDFFTNSAFTALDAKKPADILEGKTHDLLNRGIAEDNLPPYLELAKNINREVGHPMGIFAVKLYAWDHLTPLLEEIAGQMEAAGMSYSEFC